MDDRIRELLRDAHHAQVLQRLNNALPYLSDTEKRLVRYILRHAREAVGMSVSELAEAAGVGDATAFRVFRDLGFGGYSSLRAQLDAALDSLGATLIEPVTFRNRPNTEVGSLLAGVYIGMRVLLDACTIPQEELDRAARAICDCERLSIAGMGGLSARIAEMAIFSFQRLGLTSMLWVDASVVNVAEDAFHSRDVVIGISHSGENEALARFMDLATRSGATTIAITNYERSRMARKSMIRLITSFREDSVENYELIPRMSQLLVLQLLLERVRMERRALRPQREVMSHTSGAS